MWAGKKDRQRIMGTDLSDAWVGALDILTGQVQPAGGVRIDGRAVVPQGTPSLSTAPATLELPLCLQTHAAAVPLGCTLVQVHCGIQEAMGIYNEHTTTEKPTKVFGEYFVVKENREQVSCE